MTLKTILCGAVLMTLALLASAPAPAQERKAYKVVDANGNITYSQTPPADGKNAQPLSTKPAMAGRGGNVGNAGGPSPYDNPHRYAGQTNHGSSTGNAAGQPPPQEQRLAALKAECEHQRGTDCNNPATLQYMDSTSIPGGRRR